MIFIFNGLILIQSLHAAELALYISEITYIKKEAFCQFGF